MPFSLQPTVTMSSKSTTLENSTLRFQEWNSAAHLVSGLRCVLPCLKRVL